MSAVQLALAEVDAFVPYRSHRAWAATTEQR